MIPENSCSRSADEFRQQLLAHAIPKTSIKAAIATLAGHSRGEATISFTGLKDNSRSMKALMTGLRRDASAGALPDRTAPRPEKAYLSGRCLRPRLSLRFGGPTRPPA
jgi:hypothetical protein